MSLLLDQLVVRYRRRGAAPITAVDAVSLTLEKGEILGLVGETGCGKSSLAKAAVGMIPPTAGSVTVNGRPLLVRQYRRRRPEDRQVQMVFQNPYSSLNPRRKIAEQIGDGLRGPNGPDKRQRLDDVVGLLDQVGLPPTAAHRYPHEFSGGQRQRIAIARALAAEPDFLVLDEPLSSLDASVQAQVANLLRNICAERNVGMLLISHDLAIVRYMAHRLAVMYLGKIVETGPTSEVWDRPTHPYTSALVDAIPDVHSIGVIPHHIPGEVPDPAYPPSGCSFRPRCSYAFDACETEPSLRPGPLNDHAVACWLSAGVKDEA